MPQQIDLNQFRIGSSTPTTQPTAPRTLDLNQFKTSTVSPTQTTTVMPQSRGFFEELFKRPVERLVMEPARRAGEALPGAFYGFMGDATKDRYAAEVQKDKTINVPIFGEFKTRGQKPIGQGGAQQIAGEALETGSWLYTGGKAGPFASSLFKPGTVTSKVVQYGVPLVKGGAGGGAMFGAGEALQQERPEDVVRDAITYGILGAGTALVAGAVLPPAAIGLQYAGRKARQWGTKGWTSAGRAEIAAQRATQLDNTASNIMNRVARLNPTKEVKFKSMAGGKTVGQWLTERGIVNGTLDDIVVELGKRWQYSKNLVDETFAQIGGQYKAKPINTALTELVEREAAVSAPGAPSRDRARVQELFAKHQNDGLTMEEINEVKRLYESNVKLDYFREQNSRAIARANNVDTALREWQRKQAEFFGFKELPALNKETQASKFLADELGDAIVKRSGNNAITITDWILLSGGDASAIAGLIAKKTFSSQRVQTAVAKQLAKPSTFQFPNPTLRQPASPQNLLPEPAIPLGPPVRPSTVQAVPAARFSYQDPTSGRFARGYSSAIAGQTTPQPQPLSQTVVPSSSSKIIPQQVSGATQSIPIKKKPTSPNTLKNKGGLPTNGQAYAGAGAGFSTDEEGNVKFDPEKALMGMFLGTAGMRASQKLSRTEVNRALMNLEKTIVKTKRSIPIKDLAGKSHSIPAGEPLTAYRLKNGNYVLKNGGEYVVSKGVYQNVKAQSFVDEAKAFAPELKDTTEVVKGDGKVTYAQLWNYAQENGVGMNRATEVLGRQSIPQTKYKQYTLPGGEKYREILIQAPKKPNAKSAQEVLGGQPRRIVDPQQIENETGILLDDIAGATGILQYPKGPYIFELHGGKKFYVEAFNHTQEFGTLKEAEDALMRWTADEVGLETGSYVSPHWDSLDVIAHLRMTMRKYKGKVVAFMEEMQSDWAKDARAKGFAGKDKPTQIAEAQKTLEQKGLKIDQDMSGEVLVVDRDGNLVEYDEMDAVTKSAVDTIVGRAETFNEINLNGVPYHPLVEGGKWKAPTVKRALQEAVAEDAEYFAWITGDQTSARYNLATHVDNVKWKPDERNGFINIDITPQGTKNPIYLAIAKDGKVVSEGGNRGWRGKSLDEVLGKGLADKIMAKESGTLSGEGLKFGGEWANNLYDKEVKSIIEDLLGVKVELLDLGLPVDAKKKDWNVMKETQTAFIQDGKLTSAKLKVGNLVAEGKNNGKDMYIITDVLSDGRFKAVSTENAFEEMTRGLQEKGYVEVPNSKWVYKKGTEETFTLNQDTTQQQGIKLTPEIKAIIRGESPITTKPSGAIPDTILAQQKKSVMPTPPKLSLSKEKTVGLVDAINKGGITFDVVAKKPMITGFSVSPFSNRTTIIKGGVKPSDIYKFIAKNRDLLSRKNFKFGGWFNDGSGESFLDVVVVTKDKEKAVTLGKKFDQISVANLDAIHANDEANMFLDTGGTGKVNKTLTDDDVFKVLISLGIDI